MSLDRQQKLTDRNGSALIQQLSGNNRRILKGNR